MWRVLAIVGWTLALAAGIYIWDTRARLPRPSAVVALSPNSAEADLRRRLDDELATLERLRDALVLPDDEDEPAPPSSQSHRYGNRNQALARATKADLERRRELVEQTLKSAQAELDQSRREHGHDFKAELELRQNEIENLRAERDQIDKHLRRLAGPQPPRAKFETNEHRALKAQEARVDELRARLEQMLESQD